MTRDTQDLLREAGVEGFTYREITAAEEQQIAAARWPLLATVIARLAEGPVEVIDEGEDDMEADRGAPALEVVAGVAS